MPSIADIRQRVTTRLKDAAHQLDAVGLTQAVDTAIASALQEFNRIRPAKAAVAVTGNGTRKYSLTATSPVLVGYSANLSEIISIVYPYNASDPEMYPLDDEDWQTIELPAGRYLWFPAITPPATAAFLVEFTKPHTADNSTLTLDATDYEAVSDLAAHHACLILAISYAQSIDLAISADAVNRLTKPEVYRQMAKDFRSAYEKKVSGGDEATAPACLVADMDRTDTYGRNYLVHGRRRF